MAHDIVPIELGLTKGDVVTLWAPRWREDGEEWEAFLGDEDALFVFTDVAKLAAFVRTDEDHDLADHPAWHVVPGLAASELIPDDNHSYDLVGVPELVAEEPDSWTISELDDIVSMVRSIAEVCELDAVDEVLDSCQGFSQLHRGTLPFTGRDGVRLWQDLTETVAQRWDEVLDAIDEIVDEPDEIDAGALAKAEEELAAYEAEMQAAAAGDADDDDLVGVDPDELDTDDIDSDATPAAVLGAEEDADTDDDADADEPTGFWAEVGIDPIKIVLPEAEYYTLRCYLDDDPVFLGAQGKIDVYGSPRALAKHLATADGDAGGNALAGVATWPEVARKATDGDLEIDVDDDNTYVLNGIADDIADGPDAVDPVQLELAVELLSDAATFADDDKVDLALRQSESLGWLISFVLHPDPNKLVPSEPYTAEVDAWRELVADFEDRLTVH